MPAIKRALLIQALYIHEIGDIGTESGISNQSIECKI